MNKLFIPLILAISIGSNLNADLFNNNAYNWFNRNAHKVDSLNLNQFFTDYCWSRVQELDYWLQTQRRDISQIDFSIATEGLNNALKQKEE